MIDDMYGTGKVSASHQFTDSESCDLHRALLLPNSEARPCYWRVLSDNRRWADVGTRRNGDAEIFIGNRLDGYSSADSSIAPSCQTHSRPISSYAVSTAKQVCAYASAEGMQPATTIGQVN